MTEHRPNTYDDDDMRQVIDEIEALEAEKESIMAAAAGKCSPLSKKIANLKKEAKDDLKIPLAILNAMLKTRKHERAIDKIAKAIPEDLVEVYEDAAGQFSFFAPDADDGVDAPNPAQEAARRAREQAEANQAREQEEGAKILDGLAGKDAVH